MKQISSIYRFSKLKFNDIRYDDRSLFNFLSRYRGSSNIAWKLMDTEYKKRQIYKHAKWCDTRTIAWRNCFFREFTEGIVYAFIVEMYATSVKMYETIEWKYMIYGASLKVWQLKLIWILNKRNQSRNGTMDYTMHANLIEIVFWLK